MAVNLTGCLIQNQDRWIRHDGSSQCDALALSSRQIVAVVANIGLIAVGQLIGESINMSNFDGIQDFFVGHVRLAIGDIVPQRAVEQRGILRHPSKLFANLFGVHLPDVVSIDHDLAHVGVKEPSQQIH